MLPKTMAWTLTAVPQLFRDVVEPAVGDGARGSSTIRRRRRSRPRAARSDPAGRRRRARARRSPCSRGPAPPSRRRRESVSALRPRSSLKSSSRSSKTWWSSAEHDVGIHLDEAAVGIVGEALVGRRLASASTVSSLRPRLRTVSIMPGIEARAPERTETRSGASSSPKRRPVRFADSRERRLDRLAAERRADRCGRWRRSGCRPRW